MVTGANGFLASYIVKDLLEGGHTVHACVRDATRESSTQHLSDLVVVANGDRLKFFSTGNLEDATAETFDTPMQSCDAVLHAATPLNVKFGDDFDGERDIYQPAMTSTQALLQCIDRHAAVQTLVLTSSMSAMAPRPEPAVKDESHWSDAQDQQARENWYGATKTAQEQLVRKWVHDVKSRGSDEFVYAAICPTMVIGPLLQTPTNVRELPGTMGVFQKWLRGAKSEVPNDSMSFVHVEDCAKMHTRVLTDYSANQVHPHGRYMSVANESLHWNDIMPLMKELHPALPAYKLCNDKPLAVPTNFNFEAMHSLGVPVRSTHDAMEDAIRYMKDIGGLD